MVAVLLRKRNVQNTFLAHHMHQLNVLMELAESLIMNAQLSLLAHHKYQYCVQMDHANVLHINVI